MLLLTWHGTILRLVKDSGRITHSRLVPRRDLAADMAVDLPHAELAEPLAGPDGMMLLPGEVPGTVYLSRGGQFLCVEQVFPAFSRGAAGRHETLLLVPDEEVALLRDLLSHDWRRGDTGAALPRDSISLEAGPVLVVAGERFDLLTQRPTTDPVLPGRIMLPSEPAMVLHRVDGSRALAEVEIRRLPVDRLPLATTAAEFAGWPQARLVLDAPPEIASPPILGSAEDRDFLYRREWAKQPVAAGRVQLNSVLVHERNKCVLMERSIEGMILDENGVSNESDYIGNLAGREPANFGREGSSYFVGRAFLDNAPFLPGPHAVFYGGNYQNYYHWLIDAMVPLSLLAPHLPPDVTLLLPGSLQLFRQQPIGKLDYVEVLEAFGFGDLKRVEAPGQVVRVGEVYWADRCYIEQVPASALRAARDRALARRPALSGPPSRLYVQRRDTRSVANAAIEKFLERNGFVTVMMEDFTATQQMDLFRAAEFVISPHGAAMANIMFCAPGTKVLELSPDCEYRPFFAEISGKLGLTHAVLPCPTDDGGFFGRMTVNGARLNLLLNLLLARPAATRPGATRPAATREAGAARMGARRAPPQRSG